MPLYAAQPWRYTAYARRPRILTKVIVVTITGFRLIDKFGAAVASASGITALVHKQVPSSLTAPDKRVASVTTDGSGVLADIGISDVQSNADPVWLTLMLEGSPAKGTTVKVTPTVT